MSEAMDVEFGTVAEWTAQVAIDLGADYYIPAACRGSGSPLALDWLMNGLDVVAGESLLDCGAGVGGPAAYAVQERSVTTLLVEPQGDACRAARRLFGHPVVRAAANALPVADESFDAAWSLGVLCTMSSQLELLTELSRVVRPPGRIAILVFVARTPTPHEAPTGNYFPTEEVLDDLIGRAGLRVEAWRATADMPPIPSAWQWRVDEVTEELSARHHQQPVWQQAAHQSDLITKLLTRGDVSGEMLVLRHA